MIGLDAAPRHPLGFFRIAHERGHVVPGAQQRVEHRRTDIPRCPGQEDPHGRVAYCSRIVRASTASGSAVRCRIPTRRRQALQQSAGRRAVQLDRPQMSQTRSWSKNVMTPSSLTFSTGPNRLAAIAAVVRAPSMIAAELACPPTRMPQDGARGQQPACPVDDRRAVERRQGGEARVGSRSVADRPSSRWRRSRRDGRGVLRLLGGHRDVEPIGRRHQLRDRGVGIAATRRRARLRARRPDPAPSGRGGPASAAIAHRLRPQVDTSRARSSRCQAPPRNANISAPSANTLISRDGLSTAQTCPCRSVARACAW